MCVEVETKQLHCLSSTPDATGLGASRLSLGRIGARRKKRRIRVADEETREKQWTALTAHI